MRGSPRNSLHEITESLTFNLYTMKNLLLIIALVASTSLLSQTKLIIADLKYDEGIESVWDITYEPYSPQGPTEHLEKGNEWYLDTLFGGRGVVLNATKPGFYMVTQTIDGEFIQLSSVSVRP